MEVKLWFLKQCALFEQLTPEQAAMLNRGAALRTFPKRSLVYSPTEPGQSVLIVARGRVKIKDLTPDGKETILAFIEEGELFGELALLDEEPRQEYAEAVVDSDILAISRKAMLNLMEARADVALTITKLIGFRRRRIENRLRNVLFLPSRERLARLLLELVAAHGQQAGSCWEIRLPLSHQDLASLIGVTRETVTVLLGVFQAEGLIKVDRRRIVVLDPSGLSRGSDCPLAYPPRKKGEM